MGGFECSLGAERRLRRLIVMLSCHAIEVLRRDYLLEYPRPNLHATQMQVGTKPFHKGINTVEDIADAECDAIAGVMHQ